MLDPQISIKRRKAQIGVVKCAQHRLNGIISHKLISAFDFPT